MAKVLIHMSGGVVHNVFSDEPDVSVTLFDFDNEIANREEERADKGPDPEGRSTSVAAEDAYKQLKEQHPHHAW